MENWLVFLIALFIIAYLASRITIYIDIDYQRNKGDDCLAIKVSMLKGMLCYAMQIPVIELTRRRQNSAWVETEIETPHGETETHAGAEEDTVKTAMHIYLRHPYRIRLLARVWRYYARVYRGFTHEFTKYLYCEFLSWETIYGNEDASWAGIMTGMIWSIKGAVLFALKQRLCFQKKPRVKVSTIFGQSKMQVDLKCIFSIKFGNVIVASVNSLKYAYKGGNRRWENIQFKG